MSTITDDVLELLVNQHKTNFFGQWVIDYKGFARAVIAAAQPEQLTDERIASIADLVVKSMPDGLSGFCKTWGWQQFARTLLECCGQRAADVGHLGAGGDAPAGTTSPARRLGGMRGPRPPSADADPAISAGTRRLTGLWRYGARVLPTAAVTFDAWLALLDNAIDQAAPIPGARGLPTHAGLTRAASDVLAERTGQMAVHGWDAAHDDDHDAGALAQAAACYAMAAAVEQGACGPGWSLKMRDAIGDIWPFDDDRWKQGPPRRMLVKAAALLLAEIERIDRRDAYAADQDASA